MSERRNHFHLIFSPISFVAVYLTLFLTYLLINEIELNWSSAMNAGRWLSPVAVAVAAVCFGRHPASSPRRRSAPQLTVAYQFDLYTVGYAILLFTVFAQFTDRTVVDAIKEVFERGIGVVTLLALLKVAPVFISHLIRDS